MSNTGGTGASDRVSSPATRRGAAWGARLLGGLLLLAAAVVVSWHLLSGERSHVEHAGPGGGSADASQEAVEADVRRLCSHCHLFPMPDTLPRSAWRNVVTEMAGLNGYGANMFYRPSPPAVIEWYQQRAPQWLLTEVPAADGADEWRASRRGLSPPHASEPPVVSHVHFADLFPDDGLELVVCDMRGGQVLVARPMSGAHMLQPVAMVENPAHAEVVDLDQDGRMDLVVANLGSYLPLDHNLGSVEWLQQTAAGVNGQTPGVFQRRTLLDNLGRVADVEPADLDADGDIDLVVGEFGWRITGGVHVLENVTTDWERPRFIARRLDDRSGAIHVPVTDLDGDGRLDIVALLAQHHEMVLAYLNRGEGQFETRELYRAPHPTWGSSGLQLVDFDRDGDTDILLTNGDTLDDGRLKPYHGLQWLEQTDGLVFVPHALAVYYGAHRAEAADLDGDGDLDVVACAFTAWDRDLMTAASPGETAASAVGLLWLEQREGGQFVRHHLEHRGSVHATLHAADFDHDGDVDVAVGTAAGRGRKVDAWVDLWENQLVGNE